MNKHLTVAKEGFTLIEILIVVAIIAVLASVVLVGLGPTQQAGRDARRLSDLHEVQNGLELYNSKNTGYPIPKANTWSSLSSSLTGAGIGVNSVPDDPSSGKHYVYAWHQSASNASSADQYELVAQMEQSTGNASMWNNYTAPANFKLSGNTDLTGFSGTSITCKASDRQYCLSL